MTRYEFNKRFADGEQYLIQDNNGDAKEMQRDFFLQERAVYNRIKPTIEMFLAKYPQIKGTDIYGKNGLVENLIPLQRAYNALCNKKTEFINQIVYGNIIVESGSVDVDALEEDKFLFGKVLVYRQGAKQPIQTTRDFGEFDFFESERQHLLDEFQVIIDAWKNKMERRIKCQEE